jgi:hypothetical protein
LKVVALCQVVRWLMGFKLQITSCPSIIGQPPAWWPPLVISRAWVKENTPAPIKEMSIKVEMVLAFIHVLYSFSSIMLTMTYQDFVKELINRFGEEQGVIMALRAEVGFLRRFLENQNLPGFTDQQEEMIRDFLERHPAE